MQVVVDPSSRMLYASYYIKGLYEVFGKRHVKFSNCPFEDLKRSTNDFSFEHFFAFVLLKPSGEKVRVVIDFCDPPDIHPQAYEWCSIYAKINFNKAETDNNYLAKIIPIPPGFGIQIWNLPETVYHSFQNYFKCRAQPLVPVKRFFQDYKKQYQRPKLEAYTQKASTERQTTKPYIFAISSLWEDESCVEITNVYRKNFIEAARNTNCTFEGGLYAKPTHPHYEKFKAYIFQKPYTTAQYLRKTKKSAVVFNTPAVHGCHGWKLAEFLALGKVILSTPLKNSLLPSLENRKHFHLITNQKNLKDTIKKLLKKTEYRKKLEQNARIYFKNHSHPRQVIKRILQDHIEKGLQ